MSSVSEDSGEIKIYDAFFDTKQIGDDRDGVIIHEVAHLAGLRGEGNEDSAGLESAEAVKNFCLCANGRLSLEEIAAEAGVPENPDSDELTYNPDQARAPKGQSNGGQWVAEGDNGGAAKGGESKSAQKSASAAAENASPAEEDKNTQDEGRRTEDSNKRNKSSASRKITSDVEYNDRGIQSNSMGEIWGAFDDKISGLESEKSYTVKYTPVYRQYDADGNSLEPFNGFYNDVSWAYNVKTDKDGNILLKRVGILAEDRNNRVAEYHNQNIKISMKREIFEGEFSEIFDTRDNLVWQVTKNDITEYEADLQKHYGFGSYGASHSCTNAYIDEKYKANNGKVGGGTLGRNPKKSPISSEVFEFSYDKSKNESQIKK